MASDLSEQALRGLEHSTLPPIELLDQAVGILGLNLGHLRRKYLVNPESRQPALSFAPREEWVLRWLLKKLDSTTRANDSPNGSRAQFVTDTRTWILFQHLVEIIPYESLARIFQEREFLPKSIENFREILRQKEIDSNSNTSPPIAVRLSQRDDEQPRKRIKLSPSPGKSEVTSASNRQSNELADKSLVICCAIASCTAPDLAVSSTTNTWSLPPAQAAELVSVLLEMVLVGLRYFHDGWQSLSLIQSIRGIMRVWELSSHIDSGLTGSEKSNLYHVHCTKVSSALLSLLEQPSLDKESRETAKRQLEYTSSLHTILPLRAAMNKDLTAGWTKDNIVLSWAQFEQTYTTVAEYFSNITDVTLLSDRDENSNHPAELAPILLDIAIRTIPPTTLRRRQREQPWVEALFLTLAYLTCPSLPRMEASSEGILQVAEDGEQIAPDSIVGVERLLDVLIKHRVNISLPLLSYLTSAIIAGGDVEPPWTCLAKILKMDPNVLLPNSGLKNAAHCLDRVCKIIRNTDLENGGDYSMIRDCIITPLIGAFAQVRDLNGFVQIWQTCLQDAMTLRTLIHGKGKSTTIPNGLVWEDEDVFTTFKEIARINAIPSLSRTALSQALESLKSLKDRVGPTTDTFAALAILDALLVCRPEDFASSLGDLNNLLELTVVALSARSSYQSQRWRLWSVLRRCLPLVLGFKLPRQYFAFGDSPIGPLSLGSVSEMEAIENTSVKSAKFKEIIEFFHLLLSLRPESGFELENEKFVQSEITELINLFRSLLKQKPTLEDKLWDGRMNTLESKAAVAEACAGILCQKPQVLLSNAGTTNDLIVVLCQYNKPVFKSENDNQAAPLALNLLEGLLSTDEILSSGNLHYQCFKALTETFEEHDSIPAFLCEILQKMPLAGINRSRIQKLAVLMEVRLKNVESPASPEELLAEIALLEKLTGAAAVSIGKPQNWKDLVELAETLKWRLRTSELRSYQIIVRCVQGIFDSLWKRTFQLEETEKNKALIHGMMEWCLESVQAKSQFQFGLSSFIILKGLVEGFWDSKDRTLFLPLKGQLQDLRKLYFMKMLANLKKLMASDSLGEEMAFMLRSIVGALSRCSDLCEGSDQLLSLLPVVGATIMKWRSEQAVTESNWEINYLLVLESAQSRLNQLLFGTGEPAERSMSGKLEELFASVEGGTTNTKQGHVLQQARWMLETAQTSTPKQCATALSLVRGKSIAGPMRYELASAILYQTTQVHISEAPDLAEELNKLVSIRSALEVESSEELCVALECFRMILDRHPGVVNQWAVDNLLSSIAVLTSSAALMVSASQIEAELGVTHTTFDRLCDILGIVLARFRRRLQGRYHLILPVTQNLLRCLYYPGSRAFEASQSKSHTQMHFVESLPSWVREAAFPLPKSSATRFARVLSAICDPTASSVKSTTRGRSHSMTELTDSTKKAKRISGQYMQYLVMEYARCSLDGHINPETKEKLLPGMYAVLDVMPRELMRAMNAAMDASSRAIFKGLYDDYQRFGKWDKN